MTASVNTQLAYEKLHDSLDALIRTHLLLQEDSYNGRYSNDKESLQFVDMPLTLHNLTSGNTVELSSPNKELNYKYLMFRSIVGEKAAHSFGDGVELMHGHTKFSTRTLFDSFNYQDNRGGYIRKYTANGEKKIDHQAFDILKQDRDEVKKLIKHAFEEQKSECNILRNIAEEDRNEICTKFFEKDIKERCTNFATKTIKEIYETYQNCSEDVKLVYQNSEIDKYTCFETFALISNPEFNSVCTVASEL